MALKVVVENIEDVPEAIRGEYREGKDEKGKPVFTLDIDGSIEPHPLVRGLRAELLTHKGAATTAKAKLQPFEGVISRFKTAEELNTLLDRIPELEAAAEGKLDEAKINGIVETRLKAKTAPLERELNGWKTKATEAEGKVTELTVKEQRRIVNGELNKAARTAKVVDTAFDDIELYGDRLFELDDAGNVVTKDKVGVTPGLSPKEWLEDMQGKRPHWWGPSGGGGAGGNRGGGGGSLTGADNPWTYEGWNSTKQGQLLNNDRPKAEKMMKAVGAVMGGLRPPAPAKK